MASISQALLAAGGVLVLVGAFTAGFTFYEQQSNTCTPGSEFIITHLQPNETVDAPFEQDFENLSTKHQTGFREQLPVNRSEQIKEVALINETINTVVNYEGERYHIYRVELNDCPR